MSVSIAIATTDECLISVLNALAVKCQLPIVTHDNPHYDYLLVLTHERLELRVNKDVASKPFYVDFLSGSMAHRQRFGGGRSQLIAKAVGIARYSPLNLLDATAGLGRDAFVLANLGCQVTCLERSAIIAALLADGILRAMQVEPYQHLSIKLLEQDALTYLARQLPSKVFDVIYFDPMFPGSKKSALVKKEMRILRDIVGADVDAANVLQLALRAAKKRVVVKRAKLAPCIEGPTPDQVYRGKSSRFDVYFCH